MLSAGILHNPPQSQMKKNWFYIFSPCVLLAAFSIFGIISSYLNMEHSRGWSYIGVILCRNLLFFAIIVDIIARVVFSKKALPIWIIEIIAIVIFYFTYMRPFFG